MLLLLACVPDPKLPTDPPPDLRADSVDSAADSAPDTGTPAHAPLISEVMSSNSGSLLDAEGDSPDWIELYNPTGARIALEGWALEDSGDRWIFPAAELAPGGFAVVFASGKAGVPGELHASFKLDQEGEVLRLIAPGGAVVEEVEVPPLGADQSWGRSEPVRTEALLSSGMSGSPGSALRWSAAPEAGWEAPGFDDAGWAAGTQPLGHDGEEGGGDPVNAAEGGIAAQSSDGYGFTGAQAIDGAPGTFSHTADGDLEPWLEVDLQGLWNLSEITLINRADCCADRLYNVEVSILDSAGAALWTSEPINPTAAGASPVSPGTVIGLPLGAPVSGRRVRVTKAAQAGSEWLSLGELVATGVPAAPYTEFIATDTGRADLPVAARLSFALDSLPTRLRAAVACDDRFALSINGQAIADSGTAGIPHDGTLSPVALPAEAVAGALLVGENVLGLRGESADSDDLLIAAELAADWISVGGPAFFLQATPGEPNGGGYAGLLPAPSVSPERGIYDDPLTVTLTGAADSTLIYTLDGSLPSPSNGVQVPPDAGAPTVALPAARTTLVRAILTREGWAPGPVVTHTFLFPDTVLSQPAAPAGWPTVWDGVSEGPVAADYEMDPEVVDADPVAVREGLLALPSLSIVTDPGALFGPEGLYENSAERGDGWERAVSAEWLLPDGSQGFAESCGLRIHGYGWRSHAVTPKHSMRLEFSSDYGVTKLEYPIFPDAPVDRFDSIVLRAGGSKTWLDFRDPSQGQYLHDAFARDTARDMGKADGHAAFAHVYLNGLYWGVYNLVERPEADFGAEYFGGEPEEYDAINRRTTTNEAIDGTLDAWLELLARAEADLSTAAGLASVAEMLDLDDLIDYMLIHQYMVNRDGPCCFSSNNMRALRRRADGERFRLFVWDMEYSLWDAADDTNVDIDVDGSISHVYTRLRDNADFRARYAARAALHLGPGGALSPEQAAARYAARAQEIYPALAAESARWGDHSREPPYSREVEWQAEYDRLMTAYFPQRTALLRDQLRAAGLY